MKILVDMNLSPGWVRFLAKHGIEAVHWSEVGDPRASDAVLMEWALQQEYIVFTHDLDFSALLANTSANGPSVVQLRTQDVFPESMGDVVVRILVAQAEMLAEGSIVTVDTVTSRVRILPLRGRS